MREKVKEKETFMTERIPIQWKVDRVLAIHSLSSTASQGTSNIPFPWLLLLGCNRQEQWMKDAAVVQVSKPV